MEKPWLMEDATAAWEGEGGAVAPAEKRLIGTVNQVAWAEQIKANVSAEFDRVAKALESRAGGQSEQQRSDTRALIAILEEKRAEVMAKDQAGYFIHEWQELRDQVRTMITQGPRYKAIQARRAAADSRGGSLSPNDQRSQSRNVSLTAELGFTPRPSARALSRDGCHILS